MSLLFPWILGRTEPSTGWAHMQSVNACAVQTHFSVFACLLRKGLLKSPIWVNFLIIWCPKRDFSEKTEASKNTSKKGVPPDANKNPISKPRGSRRGSLACALFRQETVVWAAVEALFEIVEEKRGLGSELMGKTDKIPESFQTSWMDPWKSLTVEN